MNLLHHVNTAFILVCLTGAIGCGKDTTPAEISAAPTNPASAPSVTTSNTNDVPADNSGTTAPPDSGTTTPTANIISITYYQVTKTIAPMSGFPTKTYTATGYCTNYLGETYCWDDGKKTVLILGFSYFYSYFNMDKTSTGFGHSGGGMTADLMVEPTIIINGGGLQVNLAAGAVSEVKNTGAITTIDCTEDSGVVTCPAFTIDSNQVAIQ